jgi:hypothetical protein
MLPLVVGALGVVEAQAPIEHSLLVLRSTVARMEPRTRAEIRGAIGANTRLQEVSRRSVAGDPCASWYEVGVDAWVCSEDVRPEARAPSGIEQPRVPIGLIVPFRYGRVMRGGIDAFADAAAIEHGGTPVRRLNGGDVIAARPFPQPPGSTIRVTRTLDNLYVRHDQLSWYRASRFEGFEITPELGDLSSHGWIVRVREPLYAAPRGPSRGRASYLRRVRIAGESEGYYRLETGEFVEKEGVTTLNPTSDFPADLGPSERFVDVHIESQTMLAYEGRTPVFATAVSTGRPWRNRDTEPGVYRIWLKIAFANMDDVGNEDAVDDYSVQAVPWVQYYQGSAALHGAFWHNSFGNERSHGCVNLSPLDARRMFRFTRPAIPDGWISVRPTARDPATRIRIR